ncbi:MAG: hypothetical protein R3B82_01795 [Sandaracinaceae bacterium]
MRARLTVTIALAALGLAGCFSRPIGHFGDGAYYHARGHYRIRYGAGEARLLPEPWRLVNYDADDEGRPTDERTGPGSELTLDAQWLAGRGRSHPFQVPRVDLLYQRPGAAIWVRSVPIPRAWGDAPVRSILHGWAEAAADGRAELDPQHTLSSDQEASVTHYGEATVDGLPAHWVELAVRRPDATEQRVTWVALRPRHHQWRWHRRHAFPMLVVFGFASSANEHESVRQDFEQLVRRVDIRG